MVRRICAALALSLCLTLLAACGNKRELSGEIVEVCLNEEGIPASFVLETDRERKVGVLVSGDTHFLSWLDGVTGEEFRAGPRLGSEVSVSWEGSRQSMTAGGGEKLPAYRAVTVSIHSLLAPGAASLADGTPVDRMERINTTCYQLQDGTELLMEDQTMGPDGVRVGDLEGFDGLSEAAQARVLAYYQEQGLLYDLQEELERAYAAWLAAPEEFTSAHVVGQQVYPNGDTERAAYFVTSVTLPVRSGVSYERRLGAAFDRETGAHIDTWDLFTCPPEEAKEVLLDLSDPQEAGLRREMEAAMDAENIIFGKDGLEMWFPQGDLPSQEYTCGFYLDYDEALTAILQPWAVPEQLEELPS